MSHKPMLLASLAVAAVVAVAVVPAASAQGITEYALILGLVVLEEGTGCDYAGAAVYDNGLALGTWDESNDVDGPQPGGPGEPDDSCSVAQSGESKPLQIKVGFTGQTVPCDYWIVALGATGFEVLWYDETNGVPGLQVNTLTVEPDERCNALDAEPQIERLPQLISL